MENKKSLFVLLALTLFAGALCEAASDPKTIPPESPKTTTEPPKTTTEPPTTTPPSTTSTPASTTTAEPTPSTSTAAPVTTPAPPTPTPSPVPSDGRGNWTVSGENVTCIIAQMIVSAKVDYPLEAVNKTGKATVVVPPTAKAEGQCGNTTQWIKLTWGNNSIQVDFKKNDTVKMYYMSKIDVSLFADSNVFTNISKDFANKSFSFVRVKDDFMINLNQSFRCSREQVLQLKNESQILAELAISSVQLQAFHTGNAVAFGAAQDCELDTPDIVPIAVGCALAALVCVVLVAYLVGRRRSQALGYVSM